jgi:tripartite-type tricarboxylate transporter receptor subunit TctC
MHTLLRATLAASIATSLAAAAPGFAQSSHGFPHKPIRLVTLGTGGTSDIVTRAIGAKLSDRLGQPVVVENRAGAGGTVAAVAVAKSVPDGYSLLLQSAQFAIRAALNANLPYDPLNDFAGVTRIGFATEVLVVSKSLGVGSVREFIAFGRAKPGQVLFSSAGAGSSMHMDAERFRFAAGIKATHVGFKSAPEALVEVLAGRVHYSVPGLGSVLPLLKEGKLVALAVLTPQRSPLLPDVPAMEEVISGFERDGSYGLYAPARTPRRVVNQISREVGRILDLPDIKERMKVFGFIPAPSTPEEHDRILRADIESYSRIVRLVGLRAQ